VALLALEALEQRWAPAATPVLVAASYFDGSVYEVNPTTGALLNTLAGPNSSQSGVSGPSGVAVGPDGNLYISCQNLPTALGGDPSQNDIVRYNVITQKVEPFIGKSVLQNIATTSPINDSFFGPAGLAFGPDGNLYVSLNGDQYSGVGPVPTGAVVRFSVTNSVTNSGDNLVYGGSSTIIDDTGLVQPTGLAFGDTPSTLDTLYVCNSGVPQLDLPSIVQIHLADVGNSPTSSTFIQNGSNHLPTGAMQYPTGLTWGNNGDLYVVDLLGVGKFKNPGSVLQFSGSGEFIGTFSKSPSNTSTGLSFPSTAVFNSAGDLLAANLGAAYPPNLSGSISEFSPTGTLMKTLVSSTEFPNTGTFAGGAPASGISTTQVTLNLGNRAPTASAGGPYLIGLKTLKPTLTLHAAASDPDGDSLTYSWIINGTYGAATGANPTLTWAKLNGLGIKAIGSYNVSVEVGDGHGHVVTSAVATLILTEPPPKLTISGPSPSPNSATVGVAYILTLTGTEPLPPQVSIESWTIRWGDGSQTSFVTPNPSSGGQTVTTVMHTYAAGEAGKKVVIRATATAGFDTYFATYSASDTVTVTVKKA